MSTIKIAILAIGVLVLGALAGCGGRSLTANDAGMSISNTSGSNNPMPAISALSPASATAGSAAMTLTVNGSNFVSTSVVNWNSGALPTTYVSATQLKASVPASGIASAGSASVTVVSPAPGGGTSGGSTFSITSSTSSNNPLPAVSSLAPSSATAGGAAFTLTVNGSNFVSSSVVNWNSAALSTTYVSATQLKAAVPASDIANAGSAGVTVITPAPGGGTSASVSFTTSSQGGGGNSGPVPENVQIILQGLDYQGQQGSSPPAAPSQPNHVTIGWQSVAGASSYNIYRSVNQGDYSLYASVTAASATSAHGTYLSNSTKNTPFAGTSWTQTNIDSVWQDTAATNAVNNTKGPNAAGVYYASTGYTYKVSAIVNGVESAESSDSILVYFAGGVNIGCYTVFQGPITWNAALPSASPMGNTIGALWQPIQSNNDMNPFSGGSVNNQNIAVGGFNYIVWNIYPLQANSHFAFSGELTGDVPIFPPGTSLDTSSYGTLIANQWNTLKIPLSAAMAYTNGNNVQQTSFYKQTLNADATPTKYYIEWYFSVN